MKSLSGVMLGLALVAAIVWAQAQDDDFERFQREEAAGFQEYTERMEAELQAFVEAERRAFETFRQQVEQTWGDFLGPTEKDWVEYGDRLESRSQVDFERGEVRVEVLVDADGERVQTELQQAVTRVVTDLGSTADYPVELPDGRVDPPAPLGDRPVLEGQVATQDGTPVEAENAPDFAREVVQEGKIRTEKVTGADGQQRLKAVVVFPLIPDHLRERALRYRETVEAQARRFGLEPSLVFAVIHTESHFNPKARSSAPAYGLMQLVPTSGGREAYRYLYQEDKVLPPSYFYVPAQNIELGCAYLEYLRRRVFRRLEDDQKALYCMVAAYNTGAGNVSRAFTGKRVVGPAIVEIEKLPADRLYGHLRRHLPYEETRNYLEKVIERMALYRQLLWVGGALPRGRPLPRLCVVLPEHWENDR